MAEEALEAAPAPAKVSGGKRKLLVLIVGLVLLAALGGGLYAFLSGGAAPEEGDEAPVAEAPRAPVIYFSLEPAFVVNFQSDNRRARFLQTSLDVVTRDQAVIEALKAHMPAIRNNLLLLLSRQTYEDLISHQGKEALRAEALASIQHVLEAELGAPGVEDVFFTTFVMQ